MFNQKQPSFEHLRKIFIEDRKPVIFWVGSGASAQVGIPTWDALRKHLYDAAMERIRELVGSEGDEAEAAVEFAKKQSSLWSAFSTLKKYAGETTYKETIRSHLAPPDNAPPPDLLVKIWATPQVKGIVTLNIDGLEEKAHRLMRREELPEIFVGSDIKRHINSIGSHHPFIARLHGHHSDFESWRFTSEEISDLLKDQGYRNAINLILMNSTVVFLGISAEDAAAGGFCEALSGLGVDFGSHFWITNKADAQTSAWAERSGIQKIVYSVADTETHTEAVLDVLVGLTSGISRDSGGDPIVISADPIGSLPEPNEMKLLSEDESRLLLNRYAKHLIEACGGTNSANYQGFLNRYSLPIHQAWHISENNESCQYFGYKVVKKVSGSTFSSIWEVEDTEGNKFALKIIQLENLRKGLQLDSFRRGVQSQRLLQEIGSSTGFVKVREAFEIPPSVIMDFVEGGNLQEIAKQGIFDFWTDGLGIAVSLCNALIQAHGSKHGVLHRDVRPSNIILPYYYYGTCAKDFGGDQYDVRLLNYDMSWHKDACGKVIPGNALEAGYYPPELLKHSQDNISRTTKVDSYGVGMSIYYMIAQIAPSVAGATSSYWESELFRIRKLGPKSFPIAGRILQRIIRSATHPVVTERSTLHEIRSRIEELRSSVVGGIDSACIEHIAELLYNEAGIENYDVSTDGRKLSLEVITGRSIDIEADRTNQTITVFFENKQSGASDWSDIGSNWRQKLNSASEILAAGGWKILPNSHYSNKTIHLGCHISLEEARVRYPKVADALNRGLAKVRID